MAAGSASLNLASSLIDYFPKIILFGDSLTQFSFSPGGFGSAVADHFQRKCDVINRGFSGYTTRANKLILPRLLSNDNNPKGSIVAAAILLGSNDCEDAGIENSRHVPVDEYKENLKNICGQFKNVGVAFDRQVLITPPVMDEEAWTKHCKLKGYTMALKNSTMELYAKACLEIGSELGVEVLDLWTETQKVENWKKLLLDGLHLSVEGNRFVSQALIPILDRKLSDLTIVFPDWHEVFGDVKNLREYLENSKQ
ncbi:isoamyl acetate-hydrolyzing esterase 1 homolog isoform X2 [Dendronephthya gigantea]|uniref:isoamyl acetate-hydrolyzing esterase 1 homolog isoform X2 n=1 Tax=Dendronephthya gigantea TaxID=151771 RepID=UPI00106AB522|nr:isoamyl acetate-hydrolyzing esterase 1 homolog isoform X2 [Dendronephthya gigantea]